jgi:hypothetical protein
VRFHLPRRETGAEEPGPCEHLRGQVEGGVAIVTTAFQKPEYARGVTIAPNGIAPHTHRVDE